MSPRLLALLSAVLLTGCPKTYSVHMGDQPPEEAHYVIVQSRASGAMRVFDCRSAPDGTEWEPVCVRARLTDDAPAD